jgi:hypothetical protein
LEFSEDSRLREVHGFQSIGIQILELLPSIEIINEPAFHACFVLSRLIPCNVPKVTELAGFSECIILSSLGVGLDDSPSAGIWDLTQWADLRNVSGFDRSSLVSITFPESVEQVLGFNTCRYVKVVVFPPLGRLRIVNSFNKTSIRNLVIPASVENVQGFTNCENVELLTLSEGYLQEINAFSQATRICEVTIPRSVHTLAYHAFWVSETDSC